MRHLLVACFGLLLSLHAYGADDGASDLSCARTKTEAYFRLLKKPPTELPEIVEQANTAFSKAITQCAIAVYDARWLVFQNVEYWLPSSVNFSQAVDHAPLDYIVRKILASYLLDPVHRMREAMPDFPTAEALSKMATVDRFQIDVLPMGAPSIGAGPFEVARIDEKNLEGKFDVFAIVIKNKTSHKIQEFVRYEEKNGNILGHDGPVSQSDYFELNLFELMDFSQ